MISYSAQLLEGGCSGQSDQEMAMSLPIPLCLLHTLPKEASGQRAH